MKFKSGDSFLLKDGEVVEVEYRRDIRCWELTGKADGYGYYITHDVFENKKHLTDYLKTVVVKVNPPKEERT